MADGARDDAQGRGESGRIDPEDFGRRIREFALDAHRVLRLPDSPLDELIRLDGRVIRLLGEAPGTRSSGISPWLLAVRQRIGARLPSRPFEDMESVVA
jgi:hypothetical protein